MRRRASVVAGLLSTAVTVAAGCGPAAPSPAERLAARVAGCYRVAALDGTPLPLPNPDGFWSAPVRLDTAVADTAAPREGSAAGGAAAGRRLLRRTTPVPIDLGPDVAKYLPFVHATWRAAPPDSVTLVRTMMAFGVAFRLRWRGGDSLLGTMHAVSDVVYPDDPGRPAVARRVPCASAGIVAGPRAPAA